MIYDSDYFVGSALNGDSLSHHGVPNQKWGVKNGPPYPVKRGHDVHYSVGKMTDKTKTGLQKAGKITASGAKAVGNAAKNIVKKTSSSFTRWKNEKTLDLATKPTDNALMKSWQKHQLRVSDMTNEDLQKRIERKRLEEGYRRALRGDFTESKTWKGRDVQNGKKAVDNFMKTFGNAAVEGIAKGLSARLTNSIASAGQRKIDRRKAVNDAVSKVMAQHEAQRQDNLEKVKDDLAGARVKNYAEGVQRRANTRMGLNAAARGMANANKTTAFNHRNGTTSGQSNPSTGSYYRQATSTSIVPSRNRGSVYVGPNDYWVR